MGQKPNFFPTTNVGCSEADKANACMKSEWSSIGYGADGTPSECRNAHDTQDIYEGIGVNDPRTTPWEKNEPDIDLVGDLARGERTNTSIQSTEGDEFG